MCQTIGRIKMIRRNVTLLGCALMLTFLFAGTQAHASRVHFNYVGGSWSHSYHSGWNRYWGGPSIGFYYAPTPVYVVPGYAAPSYYTGSSFWYSNPSFGLSVNLGGGGGYYSGGHYYSGRTYVSGGHYYHGGGSFHGRGHRGGHGNSHRR